MWLSGQLHAPEIYNHQIRYALCRRLGRSEREQKISSPTGNAHVTINIYFVLLLLHVSAPIHLLYGSYLQRNTFIINAVQDVYMWNQNTMLFKILPKCTKLNYLVINNSMFCCRYLRHCWRLYNIKIHILFVCPCLNTCKCDQCSKGIREKCINLCRKTQRKEPIWKNYAWVVR